MDLVKLEAELSLDEGRRNKMYLDSLRVATIGVGHNLRDDSISDAAVTQIFHDDVAEVLADLNKYLPWYTQLSDARQRVLANMCFNMGVHGLLTFNHTLSSLQSGDYEAAALGMEKSLWYGQVGDRAKRLVSMLRAG